MIRIRSSNVIGSNCDAVVSILSTDDRRDTEGDISFFFSRLGTKWLLAVTVDSQLQGRLTILGRFGGVLSGSVLE